MMGLSLKRLGIFPATEPSYITLFFIDFRLYFTAQVSGLLLRRLLAQIKALYHFQNKTNL